MHTANENILPCRARQRAPRSVSQPPWRAGTRGAGEDDRTQTGVRQPSQAPERKHPDGHYAGPSGRLLACRSGTAESLSGGPPLISHATNVSAGYDTFHGYSAGLEKLRQGRLVGASPRFSSAHSALIGRTWWRPWCPRPAHRCGRRVAAPQPRPRAARQVGFRRNRDNRHGATDAGPPRTAVDLSRGACLARPCRHTATSRLPARIPGARSPCRLAGRGPAVGLPPAPGRRCGQGVAVVAADEQAGEFEQRHPAQHRAQVHSGAGGQFLGAD